MTNTPEFFDYQSVAREAGIADAELAAIEEIARRDYPGDQMMFELRMLRTCRAIKEGKATVADALRPEDDGASASSAA